MAVQSSKKPSGSQNPDGEEAGPDDLASLWGTEKAPKIETPKMEEVSKKIPKTPEKQTEQNITEGEIIKPSSSPEPPSEPETEFLEEGDSLAEKLEDIFSEFHIDIKKIVLGIVFFALIVAGVFYGYKGVKYFLSNRKSEPQTEIQKKPEKGKILPDSRQTGLKTVLLFGRPFFLPQQFFDGDVFLSVLLGEGKDRKSRFNYYVALLKRMQNAYGTDIKAMLDTATDRRSVLLNHLARLRKLQEEGIAAFQSVGNELQRYEPVVESIGKEQKTLEDGFFAEINALNPNTESFLNQFIEKAKQQVSVRARFRSLQTVQKFFNQALPRLDALIKDIDLNQEPLIAGLKVYDVKGSDLELIIPVNGGSEPEKRGGFPLLAPTGGVGTGSWEGITTAPSVPVRALQNQKK